MKPDQFSLISSDRSPVFQIERVSEARPEPPVFGERLLRRLDTLFIRLNTWIQRAIPASLNPFAQMGAVSNVTFVIALVSGILLLFWYSPSVNHAYESILSIEQSPYLAAWIRSLHRYSSDACMLFALLHGLQVLFARKLGGARWLAWVTGIVMIGFIWFDGWTGYWLVWDERARQIALGTAQLIDVLPLIPDPLTRSFLTDASVNSLFFFIVFFFHMLIPLAFGVALWMHLLRLNKTKFITNWPLSLLITASLIALSVVAPATAAGPARMQVVPQGFSMDWFYLLPLFLTDRLQGGMLWLLAFAVTALITGLPWLIVRRRAQPAVVDELSCNGCTQCYIDCPFNAITLLERPEKRGQSPVFARVDASKCVGCGVCVGSCDSHGIDQARMPVLDVRRWINRHSSDQDTGEGRFIAFVCAQSAGADLQIDTDGNCDQLPGYQVVPVPCSGWVHMLTVERALRKGAKGVLIAGCASNTACRNGSQWTEERLAGKREPEFRLQDSPDRDRVRLIRFDRTDKKAFLKSADAFRDGQAEPILDSRRLTMQRVTTAGILLLVLGALLVGVSDAFYGSPAMPESELVVSFKHAGQLVDVEQAPSGGQDERLPHMRGTSSARKVRVPVRLRVVVDGTERFNGSFEAGGLFNDGSSVAIEAFTLSPGEHEVALFIGDSADPSEWSYTDTMSLHFEASQRRVVQYEAGSGFSWK